MRTTGALERLAKVDKVFFDKTGTLTQLPMKVKQVFADQISETEFLWIVASIENESEHPLAQAIVERRPHDAFFSHDAA